jgi:hypothetical protein
MTKRLTIRLLPFALPALVGCPTAPQVAPSSLVIEKPSRNQTGKVTLPIEFFVRQYGRATIDAVFVDTNDQTHYNGQNWQYWPAGLLFYVAKGPHGIGVSGTGDFGDRLSDHVNVDVDDCPLCFACPGGFQHAFTGECCDGGKCDVAAFVNFGPPLYDRNSCTAPTSLVIGAPTRRIWNCIENSAYPLCAENGPNCDTPAVSFIPGQSGALRAIEVPLSSNSGSDQFKVWVTADNAGAPGTVLEQLTVTPPQTALKPYVPVRIVSTTHPALTGGTTYWLVIGGGQPTSQGRWYKSLEDVNPPPNDTFRLNATNSPPPWQASAWRSGGPGARRPAFQIDTRP